MLAVLLNVADPRAVHALWWTEKGMADTHGVCLVGWAALCVCVRDNAIETHAAARLLTDVPDPSRNPPHCTGVPARPASALGAVIKAGGDYYPGQVDYGSRCVERGDTLLGFRIGSSGLWGPVWAGGAWAWYSCVAQPWPRRTHQPTNHPHHSPSPPANPTYSTIDVVETLKQNGKFNTLVKALEATGLDKELTADKGIFCLYAPTDDAFGKLGDVRFPELWSGVGWGSGQRSKACIHHPTCQN